MSDFIVPETGDLRGGASFMTLDTTGGTYAKMAHWNGSTWALIGDIWPAPSMFIAQRWADEINGRDGTARIETTLFRDQELITVYVSRNPYKEKHI